MEFRKMVMITLYEKQQERHSLLDSVGEGEGSMIWENGIETCNLSYVKQITSPGLMHETGCSGLVHWDDPEWWDGEGGGRTPAFSDHSWYRRLRLLCQSRSNNTGKSSLSQDYGLSSKIFPWEWVKQDIRTPCSLLMINWIRSIKWLNDLLNDLLND